MTANELRKRIAKQAWQQQHRALDMYIYIYVKMTRTQNISAYIHMYIK